MTGLQILPLHHSKAPAFLRQSIGDASVSLIYVNVDNFKTFNDFNGLPMGDALLQAVAAVLRALLPAGATAYRIGGDEFLGVLPNRSHEQAIQIAEAIRQGVAQIELDAYGKWTATSPGVTLGVSSSSDLDWDALQLIQQADEANWKGKKAGKNRVSS